MSESAVRPERSLDQVEADLAAARIRLAGTVDDLAVAVSPEEVARRQLDKVKGLFLEPDGSPRVERIAKTAAVVVGLIVLRAVVRSRSH